MVSLSKVKKGKSSKGKNNKRVTSKQEIRRKNKKRTMRKKKGGNLNQKNEDSCIEFDCSTIPVSDCRIKNCCDTPFQFSFWTL